MRASLREMASPSPVPPKRCAVAASAWLNSSNSFACCSAVMPMPLSATASSTQSRPSATLRTRSATSPSFVNLQALLKRLSRTCLRRMESAVSTPTFSCASTTRRFWFFSASCSAVPMTSSISLAKFTGSGLSSSLPASILERSSISLIRLRRWVPAAFTRRNGSSAFSVPKRPELVTIISVRPMMALSGVRSSWLMLARNCDLCSLASASCRLLLDFVEQPHVFDGNHRLVGEGFDQLDLLVGKRPHDSAVQVKHADRDRFAQERYTEQCAKASSLLSFDQGVFRIGYNIDDLNRFALKQNSASYRPPTRLHWQSFDVFTVVGREPMPRHKMVIRASLTSDRGHICFTKSGG